MILFSLNPVLSYDANPLTSADIPTMDVDLDDLFDAEPAQEGPTEEHAEPLFADDDDDDNANENAEGENQEDGQPKTGRHLYL